MPSMNRIACVLAVCLCSCVAEEADDGATSGKADETDNGSFLASLPRWGRFIVLDRLDRITPVYLEQTQAVLDQIDALPPGTVEETTPLDQVPIPDLFAPGQKALLEVLDDADFTGGRSEHDVAWLRNSAVGLDALGKAVTKLLADGTNPPEFDSHLTNQAVFESPVSGILTIDVGVAAVSRFFCNLDIHIVDDPNGLFTVGAIESCD